MNPNPNSELDIIGLPNPNPNPNSELDIIGLPNPNSELNIIGLPNPNPNSKPDCNLKYFNSSSSWSACQIKPFCGVYMYQGLQTFSSYGSCVNRWNDTHPYDPIRINPYPYPYPYPTPSPTPKPKPKPTPASDTRLIKIMTNDGIVHSIYMPIDKNGTLELGENNSYTTCSIDSDLVFTLTRHESSYFANGYEMIDQNRTKSYDYSINATTKNVKNAPIATDNVKKAICNVSSP